MARQPFKLLFLPYVALREVTMCFTFVDLFDMAQLSKRSQHIAKGVVKLRNYKIRLSINQGFTFEMLRNDSTVGEFLSAFHRNHMLITDRKFGDSLSVRSRNSLKTFWNNSVRGAEQLYKVVHDLFQIDIDYANIDLYWTGHTYLQIIQWMNSMNIREITVFGMSCEEGKYRWLLDNLRSKGTVYFKINPTFKELAYYSKIDIHNLIIQHGQWITLNNLMNLKGDHVTIGDVRLTDRDVNEYLRFIKQDSNSDVTQLTLEFKRQINVLDILYGLDDVTEEEDCWSFVMSNGGRCSICDVEYESDPSTFGIEISLEQGS